VAIIARIAKATLGKDPIDWLAYAADHSKIRDLIEQCIPGFTNFNERIKKPGGFYLGNKAAERIWQTVSQKAQIISNALPKKLIEDEISEHLPNQHVLSLQTLRSHDQYNTTIYGLNDRYRGIANGRDVIFMNAEDMKKLGLNAEQLVSITSHWTDGTMRTISGLKVAPYDIPKGNVAAYYPETNPLVPLQSYGDRSFTPTSKSIAVTITAV
jgi:anaerobic selenocysteine-containing dehydrogenase